VRVLVGLSVRVFALVGVLMDTVLKGCCWRRKGYLS
jgi:hypothetical protein